MEDPGEMLSSQVIRAREHTARDRATGTVDMARDQGQGDRSRRPCRPSVCDEITAARRSLQKPPARDERRQTIDGWPDAGDRHEPEDPNTAQLNASERQETQHHTAKLARK